MVDREKHSRAIISNTKSRNRLPTACSSLVLSCHSCISLNNMRSHDRLRILVHFKPPAYSFSQVYICGEYISYQKKHALPQHSRDVFPFMPQYPSHSLHPPARPGTRKRWSRGVGGVYYPGNCPAWSVSGSRHLAPGSCPPHHPTGKSPPLHSAHPDEITPKAPGFKSNVVSPLNDMIHPRGYAEQSFRVI